ncbi:MAG: hypothetical protein CHACPFDD_04186 [Phycisphaerae bacterium]|nr:hypothetical protein [Phycisphaerae bacterium]
MPATESHAVHAALVAPLAASERDALIEALSRFARPVSMAAAEARAAIGESVASGQATPSLSSHELSNDVGAVLAALNRMVPPDDISTQLNTPVAVGAVADVATPADARADSPDSALAAAPTSDDRAKSWRDLIVSDGKAAPKSPPPAALRPRSPARRPAALSIGAPAAGRALPPGQMFSRLAALAETEQPELPDDVNYDAIRLVAYSDSPLRRAEAVGGPPETEAESRPDADVAAPELADEPAADNSIAAAPEDAESDASDQASAGVDDSAETAEQSNPTQETPVENAGVRGATQEHAPPPAARPSSRQERVVPIPSDSSTSRPPAPDEQATQPAAGDAVLLPAGVTGTLRGQVQVTPIGSDQVIIYGDERDLEFLQQIARTMEAATGPAQFAVFTLKHAKAALLAPAITEQVQRLIEIRTDQPGPADRFAISAEARSNSLIVSASDKIMATIETLIDQLDVDTGDTQFRLIGLTHIRAADAARIVAPTLQKLNQLREVPADAQASVQVEDRSNSILVIGTPKDVEEIERLIQSVDVEIKPDDGGSAYTVGEMLWINLKNANSDLVAKALTDMINAEQQAAQEGAAAEPTKPGKPFVRRLRITTVDGRVLPELDLEKPIRIVSDKGTNSLIVYTSRSNKDPLTEIVGLFDALPAGADVEIKSFALKHADVVDVGEMLQKLFTEGKAALVRPSDGDAKSFAKDVLPPIPAGITGKGLPFPIYIAQDSRSNTLFVVGRKDAILLTAGLIAEVDKPGTSLAMETHLIQLKNSPASTLGKKLQDLLKERQTALGKAQKNPEREGAIIIPDDRANMLIVMGHPDTYKMVEDLALQLDGAEAYGTVDSQYRQLQFADSAKIQAIIQEVFEKKAAATKETNPEQKDVLNVIADPRSNSVVMTGTRDYIRQANDLVDQLDRAFDPTVEFRVRAVKLNSATNIAALLTELIQKSQQGSGGGDAKLSGTPIHIAADPLSNNLLLAASKEDMQMVERWIELLDRPSEVGRMLTILPLRRNASEDVSKILQDMYKSTGGGQGGGTGATDLTVTFDPATNSVVAIGPPALVKEVETMVQRMETVDPTGGAVVRIFKLKQADAEDAGELLNAILEGRGGQVGSSQGGGTRSSGGAAQEGANQVLLIYQVQHPDAGVETLKGLRSEIRIISDVRTNSLVVTASPESMALMESLVAAVDVPPDAAKVRIFPLRNSDAEEMVKTLEALFSSQGGTGTGTTRTVSNTTGQNGQERQLVLEGVSSEGGRQQLMFTTDVRTNSVVAAGTKGYLDLVEELVLQLDTQEIKERKTFVYQPRNNEAKSLADSLKAFSDAERDRLQDIGEELSNQKKQEREIIAIANEDANVLVVSYDPQFESSVLDIVKELDQPPPQVMIQVLIIEVTLDNSLELGVEFAFQDLQFTKAGPSDTTTYDYVGGTDVGAVGAGLGGFTFTVTGADFNFLIHTLQSESNLKVLSRPMIMAMHGQEATFNVSREIPFVSGTSQTTGGNVQSNITREKVGIELTVTPQINPDGYVRMEISQVISEVADSNVTIAPGVEQPITINREANTTVTVMDSETIVLGGLITNRESTTEQKVPLMGDIPLLGELFRFSTYNNQKTELLIVLTPRVVRTVEDFRDLSTHSRDESGLLDQEVLGSPLMNKLRRETETMHDGAEGVPLEPAEGETVPLEKDTLKPEEDEYGPPVPARLGSSRGPADADSYDLPIPGRIE